MSVWYNEIDHYAADWLESLIHKGHIAPGVVDRRSIADVRPKDLNGFAQCHFFAGIGVWSYALRRAGWPDDRQVWTGSCPCQPFSAAGQGAGFDDERHLWPAFHHLIDYHRPAVVIGEQVAAKVALEWLDLVAADLEGSGYAFGAADLCAAGVGAPHIRQRLYWLADNQIQQRDRDRDKGQGRREPTDSSVVGWVADDDDARLEVQREQPAWQEREAAERGSAAGGLCGVEHTQGEQVGVPGRPRQPGDPCGELADAHGGDACPEGLQCGGEHGQQPPDGRLGSWGVVEWVPCKDGVARPIEPGTFPLAHGAPARVGRLRAYGNAIVAPLAEEFIRAYLDVEREAA